MSIRLFILKILFPMIVYGAVESDINGIISNISELSIDSIKINALNMNGLERGIAEIFLAASDKSPSIHTQRAYDTLMSYCVDTNSALQLALKGTAASLMARDVNDDIKATKYVGAALKDLDRAVALDKTNHIVRIYRINALVEVPEIFKVNKRIKDDYEVLKKYCAKSGKEDWAAILAMAAAEYRFGKLADAVKKWELILKKVDKMTSYRNTAKKMMDMVYE